MRMKVEGKLIDKPILPTLIALSWPIMIGEAMQLMYNLADTFWVGRLGPEYLAAISISFPLIFIVFSLAGGFSIAGMALVSQYTGAGEGERANLAAGQILFFAVVLSAVFAGIGLMFGRRFLAIMGAGPDVLPPAWAYFQLITAGIPLAFIYFIFSSVLQGVGDTITPMKLKLVTVSANIILDPIFIFGWGFFPALGIRGAAVATILSRFVAAGIGVYLLFGGKKGIHLKLHHLRPDWKVITKILRIGMPAAVGMSGLSIALTIMTSIVASFGTFTLAAWGIANRITSMIRMPAMGMGRATGVLVGQHLGADQPDQAGKTAWTGAGVTFTFMLLLAALMLFVAPYLVMVFTDEPGVVSIGAEYLSIAGFAYAFLGIQQVLSGALNGAGKTVEQTFFRLFTLWVLQIPLSYLLAHNIGWDQQGIWWGIFFAKLLGTLILMVWFVRGTWQTKVIEKQSQVSV